MGLSPKKFISLVGKTPQRRGIIAANSAAVVTIYHFNQANQRVLVNINRADICIAK